MVAKSKQNLWIR